MNADLLTASYTNHDAAYALSIPGFSDYRKNWERNDFVKLPRLETFGRAGSQYRIAHLYEYALMAELQRAVPRAVASSAIFTAFRDMIRSADGRINALNPEDRRAIREGGTFTKEEYPLGLGGFVDFPGIYFDGEFLARDLDTPLFWIFDPVEVRYSDSDRGKEVFHKRTLLKVKGEAKLAETFRELREADLRSYAHPDDVPRWSAFVALNVTDTLLRVDDALRVRLRGRELDRQG